MKIPKHNKEPLFSLKSWLRRTSTRKWQFGGLPHIIAFAFAAFITLSVGATNVIIIQNDGSRKASPINDALRLELTDNGTRYLLVDPSDNTMLQSGAVTDLHLISLRNEETPTKDETALQQIFLDGNSADGELRIYDLRGILVRTLPDGKLNTNGLSRGLYVVVRGSISTKIIVK